MSSKRPASPGAEEILGLYFPVLDHGFVSLVDYMGTDQCIERAARVSYGYGTRKASQTRGLLRYLRRHLHTTPSEMVELKFHCCMPMFIARQWIRHRTACLAGDAQLVFDLPGAKRRGRRQTHKMTLDSFYRMWTEGTTHPIAKKKPTHLERIDLERKYTIPELARLVERREETLREYVRSGALPAERATPDSPRSPSIFVSGRDWKAFADRKPIARVPMRGRLGRMRLRSCDEESGEIIHTNVVDIWQSGEKPVFRLTLEDGRSLKMSKDHRCLTEQGWLTLDQATKLRLSPAGAVSWSGDAPRFAVNGTPAYQDRDWLAAQRAQGLGVQEIAERAGISTHSIRKYLKKFGLTYTAKERARLSGLSQRGQRRTFKKKRVFTEAHLEAIQRARSGPASNFWKGGSSSERELTHHVDPVWHNFERARDIDNLISLCGACHDCLHADNLELALLEAAESGMELRDFWHGRSKQPRPEGKRKPPVRRLVRSYMKVAKIEYVGVEMTYDLEVSGPWHNFVADGFIVHNSVNEYSGRYSLMPMLFHTPTADQLQTQSRQNNQGRSGEPVDDAMYREALERWERIRKESAGAYEWMTSHDVARELARIDLPLSTYTQWYWKIDLHNLLHFLKLRVDTHAQWEIQEYGRVMAGMLKRVAPLSYEAWIDYDVCGTRMSRMELDALRRLVDATEDGVGTRDGASLDAGALSELGLSKREVRELVDKLGPADKPDFELDLSKARSAEEFAERFAKAVPSVDKAPNE